MRPGRQPAIGPHRCFVGRGGQAQAIMAGKALEEDHKPRVHGTHEHLDGLRGLLCVTIMNAHFICGYFPALMFFSYEQPQPVDTDVSEDPAASRPSHPLHTLPVGMWCCSPDTCGGWATGDGSCSSSIKGPACSGSSWKDSLAELSGQAQLRGPDQQCHPPPHQTGPPLLRVHHPGVGGGPSGVVAWPRAGGGHTIAMAECPLLGQGSAHDFHIRDGDDGDRLVREQLRVPPPHVRRAR
jgi:hypothetical protein